MEKKYRDYLRRMEKLDYEVISEEEVWEEREKLQIRLSEIHQEMIRTIIPMMAFLICSCIFLQGAFSTGFLGSYIAAGGFALITLVLLINYRTLWSVMKKLGAYMDKLSVD